MNLSLDLGSEAETQLLAMADRAGISPDALAKEAVERMLAGSGDFVRRRKSSRGLLAHLGQAPSAGVIDENRREMFVNFPRDPGAREPEE